VTESVREQFERLDVGPGTTLITGGPAWRTSSLRKRGGVDFRPTSVANGELMRVNVLD
jgi:hypothetical protein